MPKSPCYNLLESFDYFKLISDFFRLTETEWTFSKTSLAAGLGTETSSYCKTSGPPNSLSTIAFIAAYNVPSLIGTHEEK